MATALHVQGPPAIVPTHVQPLPPQQPPRNLSTIKGLAVTQLVIGIFTVILGIAAVSRLYANTWTTNTGAGIWAGGWIVITGIIGVSSSRNYNNNSLNGVYMAFSIISTCASALAGLFFIVAVIFYAIVHNGGCYYTYYYQKRDCNYRRVGLGIHVPLLIMMVVEFFVSIIAAVFCCQNGCGRNMQTGVIVQQPHQVMMVTTPGNTTGAYPANVVQYPQYGGQQFVPQYSVQVPPHYSNQMPPAYSAQSTPVTQPQYPQQANVTYPEKPPDYAQ